MSLCARNRLLSRGAETRNPIGTVKEADILNFVRNSIGSVWALEMLLLVGGRPERAWQPDELVRELRSSPAAVSGAALLLERAGLIAKVGERGCRYQPVSPELDAIGELVRKVYAAKPATVIGAIFDSSDDKLRAFAAAFRFKE
jgi:hypothetical protein